MSLPTGNELKSKIELYDIVKMASALERKTMLLRILEKYPMEAGEIIRGVEISPFKDLHNSDGMFPAGYVEECMVIAFKQSRVKALRYYREYYKTFSGTVPGLINVKVVIEELMALYAHRFAPDDDSTGVDIESR